MNEYRILDWDSAFLGYKVAIIDNNCLSPQEFILIYNGLMELGVKLIYWPSKIDCKFQDEISKEKNGLLADEKTTYEIDTHSLSKEFFMPFREIEFYSSEEIDEKLLELGVQCGEYSRFKIDSRIPYSKFADLYKEWMKKSVTGIMADDVIIVRDKGRIIGVITVSVKNYIGDIGLVGVDENFRGQGVGGKLIKAALGYFIEKKCEFVHVVTQGNNEAACKLYEKYGFVVKNKLNYYHFWV